MSNFDKVMVALVDDALKPVDFTTESGFVDCFTFDLDHPVSGEYYIMFDDTVRNDKSKDLAIRLFKSKNVKKTYVKYIDNKPYYIYVFWLNGKLTDEIHSKVFALTPERLIKAMEFWGLHSTETKDLLMEGCCKSCNIPFKCVPCEDYNVSDEVEGLVI